MINKKITRVVKVVGGVRTTEKTVVYENVSPFQKYFSENFLKTLAAALTGLGFLGIYAYHFSVEYYPVFDIKSAASLIFAVAYTGIILLITMGLFILAPAFLVGVLCIDTVRFANVSDAVRELLRYFLFAFVGFFSFGALLWWGGEHVGKILLLFSAFTLVVGSALFTKHTGDKWKGVEKGFLVTMVSMFQFLPIYFYILILDRPHQNGLEKNYEWHDFFGGLLAVDLIIQLSGAYFVIAWFCRVMKSHHKVGSLVMVVGVVFFITIVGGHSEFLGARIANVTKFGNFYATDMVLSKEGCRVANSSGKNICSGDDSSGFRLCGAFVVSRIGSESYLKIYDDKRNYVKSDAIEPKQDNFSISILVPSKEILGMSLYDKKGILVGTDPGLIAAVGICRIATKQEKKTVISLKEQQFFEFDKDTLKEAGKAMLSELAERIATLDEKNWKIRVSGYADQIGSENYNLGLSMKRASAVAGFLQLNLPVELKANVVSTGAGSTSLKRTDEDCPKNMLAKAGKACLADNRRTEIEIDSTKP
jgi:outer membrane protein OmpA-like peptidoglycan-associated protein